MFDPNSIQPIGSENVVIAPEVKKDEKKATFSVAPNQVTLSSFFGKIVIGVITGGIISALLFAILSVVGGLLSTESSGGILGPLLAFIGFIAGMLGNMGLALFYNLFFSKRYYSLSKMLGLVFTSSIIIFLICIPLYFLPFADGQTNSFTILGFQIIFSCFLSINLIEYLAQPNYSASSLLGNTLGFMISILVFMSFISSISGDENQTFLFMLAPTMIAYISIIAGNGIRDAIYYKLFQRGNNPFYLKSSAELSEEEKKAEQINAQAQQDVNIDVN
ncbi:hypothetical protein AGMMS50249_2190 [candidate division SR1 bacterium]|nr:hypothetical protein AGMMS50249_2190 [candidate division SR1 bacterium]